jgi:hypothetical protein
LMNTGGAGGGVPAQTMLITPAVAVAPVL